MPVVVDQSIRSLEGRRRRPATDQRTGRRRGRFAFNAGASSKSSALVKNASTRHTRIRQETGGNHIATLNRLIKTLQESGIPGPQLFRLNSEFSQQLGQGGQGNVRGLDDGVARQYRRADKRIHKIWPVKHIAIKQHIKMRGGHADTRFFNNNLSSRFRAAECEVLALSPGLFRDHPNIVKLVGWGLCLDTIEDPLSPCCGGLQLPLLVFERAEMDLAEFLDRLFPEPQRSDDARAEEGLVGSALARRAEPQRSRWSSRLQRYWTSLQRWSGLELDPYEVVRLLCIDVGHGLRSLHENHFTHGDLKPENVLIFNISGKWTAKLCDFGCAVGQDKTTAQQHGATASKLQKEEYLGTPYWLPSDRELAGLGGFESLQKCDLYVYGLLVWSSFCLRGKHPRARPELDDALSDLKELGDRMTYKLLPLSPHKQRLLDQVSALLEKTMVTPADRSLKPWTCLYLHSGEGGQHAEPANSGDRHASERFETILPSHHTLDTKPPGPPWSPWPHMKPETKARYKNYFWWRASDNWPGVPLDEDGDGPASEVPLHSDDNCLSTALFVTLRRAEDAKDLPRDMMRIIHKGQGSTRRVYMYPRLYYLARFRSRVKLAWWTVPIDKVKGNILRAALRASPPVDINTLAWLCAGPIGSAEVKALDGDFATWDSILEPGKLKLDASARLDRFLLLLQFGAHVERKGVFSRYLRSCRLGTIHTVMREIIHRLDIAWREGRISSSTLDYFAGRAEWDLSNLHYYIAKRALAQYLAQKRELFNAISSRTTTERDPLLPRDKRDSVTLPTGWKRHRGNRVECFEDKFTRSVTLTQPKISPLNMRQIKVGFLQTRLLYHVDLLSCMRAGSSQDRRRQFEQDLENRFPYYDSSWFSAEWYKEPNTNDVLKALEEPWRIQTFTTLLYPPGLMDKTLAFLRMAVKALAGGILVLALVAILVAVGFAMWITFRWVAVGMIAWWCVVMLIILFKLPRMQ